MQIFEILLGITEFPVFLQQLFFYTEVCGKHHFFVENCRKHRFCAENRKKRQIFSAVLDI